jgi:glutamyl-tRNA reductase
MTAAAYDLRVLGLNLAAGWEPTAPTLSRGEVARVLRGMAARHPAVEAVVLRARNHVEAYVAAPHGSQAVRALLLQIRRVRPDLLDARCRPYYYHLREERARLHLHDLAGGRYSSEAASSSVHHGVKSALGLAARYGTLGETLDGLFVQALGASPAPGSLVATLAVPITSSAGGASS